MKYLLCLLILLILLFTGCSDYTDIEYVSWRYNGDDINTYQKAVIITDKLDTVYIDSIYNIGVTTSKSQNKIRIKYKRESAWTSSYFYLSKIKEIRLY